MLDSNVTPIARPRNPQAYCSECGIRDGLHRGITGRWLDCSVARLVKRAHDMPEDPARYTDPFLPVTLRLHAAVLGGELGPRCEILLEGQYTRDEQLAMCGAAVKIVIAEYLAMVAGGRR